MDNIVELKDIVKAFGKEEDPNTDMVLNEINRSLEDSGYHCEDN